MSDTATAVMREQLEAIAEYTAIADAVPARRLARVRTFTDAAALALVIGVCSSRRPLLPCRLADELWRRAQALREADRPTSGPPSTRRCRGAA